MNPDSCPLAEIPGLLRFENTNREELMASTLEMTRAVYPHEQIYGQYCTIHSYVECPPELTYEYLSQGHNLEEWTYSVRDFKPAGEPGLWVGVDRLEAETKIYCRTIRNDQARTVDFHCSWDFAQPLWMIYLMRVIDAQLVFNKPGSVITWTNCRHPFYDDNPHPELAPKPDRPWVGDFWDLFYAGHAIEMNNLKAILEYRYRNGLPISNPPAKKVVSQ